MMTNADHMNYNYYSTCSFYAIDEINGSTLDTLLNDVKHVCENCIFAYVRQNYDKWKIVRRL